jgi:hypothetical protein
MSAERVDGASTREGGETARRVPRRAGIQRYWVIARDAKDGFGQPDLLTVDLDGTGETLPVFSFEEEAEMFLWLQRTEDGREVRETTPGQLVSILYGPCADVGRVMLDPLPEIGARMQISLLGMDRNDFVGSVWERGAWTRHISPRTARCERPRRPLPAPRRRGSDLPPRRRRP